jgi:signal peptidase I
MDDQNEEIEAEERPTRGQVALDWGLTIAIPLAVGLLIHFFVLEAFIVPSGSMLNTVQLNDRLWSEKVSYRFRAPERGEVVLFDSPSEEGVVLIKRVIALEGETVDLKDGHVLIDGKVLEEPYTEGRPSYPLDSQLDPLNPVTFPYVVPEGHVWLMGDNRTNSLDSRYFGAVPVSTVFARALCTYWPLDHIRPL